MRYALVLLLILAACGPPKGSKVDPQLVGEWEMSVPNPAGVARWVWNIHADGTYDFHAEGPGNVPSHSGTFSARDGQYTLNSTTMSWADSGTYQEPQGDAFVATGRLGTGTWQRVRAGGMASQSPASPARPSSPPLPPAASDPNFAQVTDPFQRALCKHLLEMDYAAQELPNGYSAQAATQTSILPASEQSNIACQVKVTFTGPDGSTFDALTLVYRTRAHAEDIFHGGASLDPAYSAQAMAPAGQDMRCGSLKAEDGQAARACEALERQAPKSDKIPPVIVTVSSHKGASSDAARKAVSSLIHTATDHVTFAVGFASLDLMFGAPSGTPN